MASDLPALQSPARQEAGAWSPYLRAIGHHKLLVAGITLASLIGCLLWLSARSPTYETSAEILVTPLPDGDITFQGLPFLRDYGDATRTIQTAATLVDSPAAATLTAKRMGSGWDAGRVDTGIEVQPQGESSVLAITAKETDPETAAKLANTFARAALDTRRSAQQRAVSSALTRLERQQERLSSAADQEASAEIAQRISSLEAVRDGNDPTLSFSERAAVPGTAIGTPKPILILLSIFAGFAVASGVALLLELLDRRVRDEEELLSILPVPVLARAPVMPRQLRRGALSAGEMPPGVREAFRTLRLQLERENRPGHRTVMMTSASSGDGKTSSAVHLALSLVGGGHRVVLIDFDLRKPDVARTLGMSAKRSLVATLTGTPLSELLMPAPQLPPLQVVPAAGAEGDVALLESLRRRLPAILEEARALADYVVLDTAPLGEVSDALTIADQVDDVVVVARPGHTNRQALETARDLLVRAGVTPTGLLLVTTRPGRASNYYTYGTAGQKPRTPARVGSR